MIIIGTLIFILVIVATIFLFMQQEVFGKNPTGERQRRILQSPNYRNGAFQNLTPTEMLLKGVSYPKIMWESFNKPASVRPPRSLPAIKTDLKSLKEAAPVIVWFGHSSYLIKSKGVAILVDPVLQGNAAPVSFFGKPFDGTDIYAIPDLPHIDLVLLTHDHYDHLHYKSISQLAPSADYFCTSLGVGAHVEHWGVGPEKITELDWWESKELLSEIALTATPARHFSGRTFKRGTSLWSSFVLNLHGYNLFLGGDSGYETHFKQIGQKFGPFDLAILECGQYGKNWPYIHMLPEETVLAAIDLNAKVLMPVHWAKFDLAFHVWDDSIKRVTKTASEKGQAITTPMIGEPMILNHTYPDNRWWEF